MPNMCLIFHSFALCLDAMQGEGGVSLDAFDATIISSNFWPPIQVINRTHVMFQDTPAGVEIMFRLRGRLEKTKVFVSVSYPHATFFPVNF